MAEAYTIAEVARIAGAKPRTIQLMAEGGAIIPEGKEVHSGKGAHRRFDKHEVAIACLLNAFARRGMPIGQLKAIGNALRRDLRTRLQWAIDFARDNRKSYLLVNWAAGKVLVSILQETDFKKRAAEQLPLLSEEDGFGAVILVNLYWSRLPA